MSELTRTDIKTLRSIRNMVKKTHWIKSAYEQTEGDKPQYCLVGFVNLKTKAPNMTMGSRVGSRVRTKRRPSASSIPESPSRRRLLNALQDAIQVYLGRKTKPLIEEFNDSKKTNRDDILAVLDLAIGDEK